MLATLSFRTPWTLGIGQVSSELSVQAKPHTLIFKDYSTFSMIYTKASMIVTSITEFKDTIITNYHNTTSSIHVTAITSSDYAENPLTQNCYRKYPEKVRVIAKHTTIYDYGALLATMAVEMQGTVTQLSSDTMCVPIDWQCLHEVHTDWSAECHRTRSTCIQRLRF